jgi:RimJ/RimL family protein N-acetyltransferase
MREEYDLAGRMNRMELRPDYPVTTERLSLRPPGFGDVADMLSYRGRADVTRFLPFGPMDETILTGRLRTDYARTVLDDEGQFITLAAERRSDGRVIGDVVLFLRSVEHRAGELGYVFHPDVAGQGYAFEASSAVLGLAFEQLGLHRVVARLDGRNVPSARLAARLGLRKEAEFRQNEWWDGEWTDEWVYALLESEWPASPAARSRARS